MKTKKSYQNTQYISVDTSSHRETVLDISRNGIVSRNGRSFRGPLHSSTRPPPPFAIQDPFFKWNRLFFSPVPSISLWPPALHFGPASPFAPHPAPLIRPIRGSRYRSVPQGARSVHNGRRLSERPIFSNLFKPQVPFTATSTRVPIHVAKL